MARIYSILFVILLLVAGCAGESSAPQASSDEAAAPEASSASSASDGMQEVVIQPVGDQMKFASEEFTVQSGSKVRLVMDNVATLDAMQHNIVILSPGSDINTVGAAAIQAGPDNDYVPADNENILFYTAIAGPGEQTVVEFTAPAPGEYPFICTFPGHYSLMKGVMIVE